MTFDEAARKYLSANKAHELSNRKRLAQWESTLEVYASPVIGQLPVDQIELAHIIRILEPIWTTKTETAKRLRGRIESVLAWATVGGYRTGDNPARWKNNLDVLLAKPGRVRKVKHHRAMPFDQLPKFINALRQIPGTSARALEFLILTATRSGEVRGASWDEVDLQSAVWIIPPERMKAKREHRVPLSSEAVALLRTLPRFQGSPLIYPAPRTRGPMADMALLQVVRRMGVDAVPHGFRSTFRDWCAERTNFPRDVAEMALAHTIGDKVEAAYRRGDLMQKRTQLMQAWAKFCSTVQPSGVAVPLRKPS
jgi:integrase